MVQDVLYWLWLAEKCGVASKYFDRLIYRYEDPFDIYRLENDEIEQLDGIGTKLKENLAQKDLDTSYDILKYCKKSGVDIITYGDKRYPSRLKNMVDPPILLYCKGYFPDFNDKLCIGMVGTRRMSEYGKQSAYKIAYDLAGAGALIVSGMALGIDGTAAVGALAAGGSTVAVLGCGIDTVYPKNHKRLMDQIVRHGAVISEYPPKEPPHAYNFPKRNRIISGLCQGVVVVEGAAGSGALITANLAIGQGRQVFAIPGNIDEAGAEGPNSLIREGAYPVLCAEDVFKHYEFLYSDVIDKQGYLKARGKTKDVDAALKKYGLSYALVSKAEKAEKKFAEAVEGKAKKDEVRAEGKKIASTEKPNDVSVGKTAGADDRLDATTRKIFESIPLDKPISIDEISVDGVSVAELITALTMLEIYGLVTALPGGLYTRK